MKSTNAYASSRLKKSPVVALLTGIAFGWICLAAIPAVGQEKPAEEKKPKTEATGKEFDLESNLKSFDQVWSTIKKTHWDEKLVGENWDKAREKFRPKVEAAKSISEVRGALEGLISELGQSHFGIIPNDAYDVVDNEGRGGDGFSGLEFRSTDDGILVTRVVKDSPADKAGIKPGWALDKIGDSEAGDILAKCEKAAKGPTRAETLAGLALDELSTGATGIKKPFVLRDGDGKTATYELEMVEQPGRRAKFGNLPEMNVTHSSKTIDGNIGYFRFNLFFDPTNVMTAYNKTVNDEKHTGGIVIDVRGNRGGIAGMTMGMARAFVEEQSKLGVMSMKGTEFKFNVFPNSDPVTCPVAILIDECSISSSEIFAGGLQDLGVARVFGKRTAGLALPSTVVKLPNGDGFQYAIADYVSEDGKTLEKDGVTPDEMVVVNRATLLEHGDPVLNAALNWIKKENAKK